MFNLFYGLAWVITWLPLRVLYLLSDFFYLIVYYIIRYRRKVVRKNLVNSFPDKSLKDILIIEKKFYLYFCDLIFETLKLIHIGIPEIQDRMRFKNVDLILDQHKAGKSVFLMSAHYGNWEFTGSLNMLYPSDGILQGIYKKLKNKDFDQFMIKIRQKFNSDIIEKNELLKKMIKFKNEGKIVTYGMISDQAPRRSIARYFTSFLNQETAFLEGTDQLARKFDYPVFYLHIDRLKRGYYECEFIPLSLEPKTCNENEITEKFARILEEKIIAKPEYWLWSHNRWKYTKK